MPPASGLRGLGTPSGNPAGFLGPSGLSSLHFSSTSPPLLLLQSWRAPHACLSCSALASLLHPQDQHGPEGASEGVGSGQRGEQTSLADWAGETLGALPPDPSSRGSLQAWEPLPPLSHSSGTSVLSGLHFSCPLSPPTSYRFAWGFLLSPWVSRSLTSLRQAP